jgi:hypothetical protein
MSGIMAQLAGERIATIVNRFVAPRGGNPTKQLAGYNAGLFDGLGRFPIR